MLKDNVEYQKLAIENRINCLRSRTKENDRIIQKLARKLHKLQSNN